MKGIYTALIVLSLLAVSCRKETASTVEGIVRVGDRILTQVDLNEALPPFSNPDDSTLAAEHYIRSWINDNLLYEVAKKNISNKETIDQLVENYRKSLIIYQYQEELVNEKVSKTIDDRSIAEYYEANKERFRLDRPLIKGLFLKIPIGAPQIEKVRSWYRNITPATVDDMEKYCVKNAGSFDCFVDKWVDLNELMDNWPVNYTNETDVIRSNKFIEQKDDTYYYFLNISGYVLAGDITPLEFVKSNIKEILINQKKIDFLRKTEEELYNKALNNGQINYLKG
ncbi:hypothetical protein AGMMS50262_07200 [Bacteroidia bacterium]|nr:hypothetical protein AGMMS50262_07200 [Bacteroidia bacterium]